jgi:hypothetical protein
VTNDELAEARRLCEAATDGPWEWDALKLRSPGRYAVITLADGGCAADDTAFIAAARSLVPALIAEVERLTTRNDELLAAMVRVANETPFADEAKDALAQRGRLLAEIGTLRAALEAKP